MRPIAGRQTAGARNARRSHLLVLVILAVGAACIIVSWVQASFFEWAFHRYWLHRPWLPKDCFTTHTLVHHQLCKHDDTFHVHDEEQHEALSFAWWGGPVLISINLVPWSLATWGLVALGVQLPYAAVLISLAVGFVLYYIGYEGSHYLMHKPTWPWVERFPYFRFIERHHRIHHTFMDRNLNVFIPIADLVLGTFVAEAPEPTPTPEAARRLARRHSRFGKRLRGEQP